jgi:hypothetical protein
MSLAIFTLSLEVGITIILDVLVLTLLLFRTTTLTWTNWGKPLTYSHILFIVISLVLVIVTKNQPWLFGIVGFMGALLIFALLLEMSQDWLGKKTRFSITELIKKLLGSTLSKFFTPMVLAVSWDALVGGPGLMLVIATWPPLDILVGLGMIAAVVAGGTMLAIAASHLLNLLGHTIPSLLLTLTYGGKLGLMALLSVFMINGLNLGIESFGFETTVQQPILMALLLTLGFFLFNHKILLTNSRNEVAESLDGTLKVEDE